MYELKKNGKVFTSKFVGTGPSSYEKRIYRAVVSQRLKNTAVETPHAHTCSLTFLYTHRKNQSPTDFLQAKPKTAQGQCPSDFPF